MAQQVVAKDALAAIGEGVQLYQGRMGIKAALALEGRATPDGPYLVNGPVWPRLQVQ